MWRELSLIAREQANERGPSARVMEGRGTSLALRRSEEVRMHAAQKGIVESML
jgi:hypothetical protein